MIDLRYIKKLIDMLDGSTVDSIEISSDKGMKLRIAKSPGAARHGAGGRAPARAGARRRAGRARPAAPVPGRRPGRARRPRRCSK
jgi:acetyl-CoA carboxylase biotin carboxyl carrier protein